LSRETRLASTAELWELAALGARDGLWHWDLVRGVARFSPRWKSMLGLDDAEIGTDPQEWLERIHPDDRAAFDEALDAHLENLTPHLEVEYRIRSQVGGWRWVLCRGVVSRDPGGVAVRIGGSQTDVTEQKLAVEELIHQASHDSLTGLPNRILFSDRLEHAIERVGRDEENDFAVLFLDLDRFKLVNDTWGHQVGDEVLLEISRRLQRCIRPGDTIARMGETVAARLGGDEFTILLEDIRGIGDAVRVATRILEAFRAPIHIAGRGIETTLSASIGIATASIGYQSAEELLRDADAAMYRAKRLGKARIEICDPDMHRRTIELIELENDLGMALERNELRLLYQPLVDLETGRLFGFEALIRWHHPTRGVVMPADFIRIAEDSGAILEIGQWVVREACAQLAEWSNISGSRDVVMSVNVSARQLGHAQFAEDLLLVMEEHSIDPRQLKLEVTESAIVRDFDRAIDTLRRLAAMNVEMSVDDFGTGYSSFSYLHRFPISTLKIDQSFVQSMDTIPESRRIVEVIIPLAEVLGVRTIAEGVENEEQIRLLRSLGCHYGQGFHLGLPLEREEAAGLLRDGKTWALP